jgi:DNA (cytosine-5)-methyltransferase 1
VRIRAGDDHPCSEFLAYAAPMSRPTVLEFFAGGGMARAGLGPGWRTTFANDFDADKADAYAANWGERPRVADIWTLSPVDIPGRPDLAWASSPCQDFSLAGARLGLDGPRSSALLGFWRLMQALDREDRAPATLAIENVTGLLTASGGRDLSHLCDALAGAGYRVGAIELDAVAHVPQSRPRVFIIASRREPGSLAAASPGPGHTRGVCQAHAALGEAARRAWVWWRLPAPPIRNADLASMLLPDEAAACWWSPAKTERLLEQMQPLHRSRLDLALRAPGRTVAAAYRRTRGGVPCVEARFDGVAGCLRTPAGGSSRQIVLVAESGALRVRWLLPREAARLMGLPDDYVLPTGSGAALKLLGDGVAAPVVRWIAEHLLEPLVCGVSPAGERVRRATGG